MCQILMDYLRVTLPLGQLHHTKNQSLGQWELNQNGIDNLLI